MAEKVETEMTAREIVMSYVANRLRGMDQHDIAMMYGVNAGRVSEAVTAIEYTIENLYEILALARGKKQLTQPIRAV